MGEPSLKIEDHFQLRRISKGINATIEKVIRLFSSDTELCRDRPAANATDDTSELKKITREETARRTPAVHSR